LDKFIAQLTRLFYFWFWQNATCF